MKVLDAWVSNPLASGNLAPPELNIRVEDIDLSRCRWDTWQRDNEVWFTGTAGQFVKYELTRLAPDGKSVIGHVRADAAPEYNTFLSGVKPPIMDVFLITEHKDLWGWGMLVDKARQVLRQYDDEWKLDVDERMALDGKVAWILRERNRSCRHMDPDSDKFCGERRRQTVVKSSPVGVKVEVDLCADHLREWNNLNRNARVTSR